MPHRITWRIRIVSTATAATEKTTWQIDAAHSHVEFAVKHLMIATVKGRFGAVSGTVTVNGDDPAGAAVAVSIDAASVDTREPQRDGHLKSADFFDVEKFPTITFASTRVEKTGGDTLRLTGDLTIHGVTRPITLAVTDEGRAKDPWGGERRAFSATGKVNRKDFGLLWNQALEAGGVLVGDEVKISIEVELVRQAAEAAA
jgi:polyisoprenoid-binding protein YceI